MVQRNIRADEARENRFFNRPMMPGKKRIKKGQQKNQKKVKRAEKLEKFWQKGWAKTAKEKLVEMEAKTERITLAESLNRAKMNFKYMRDAHDKGEQQAKYTTALVMKIYEKLQDSRWLEKQLAFIEEKGLLVFCQRFQ